MYPKVLCAPRPLLSCFPRLSCSVQSVPFSAVSPPLAHVNFIQQQLKATEVFICSRAGGGRNRGRGRREKWSGREKGGGRRNGAGGGDGVLDSCLAHTSFHGTDHGAWHSWMLLAPYKKDQAPFKLISASQPKKAPQNTKPPLHRNRGRRDVMPGWMHR